MESRLLLDVVVSERATVLELLTGKDETLGLRHQPRLILDLGLDVLDGVRCFDLQGDRLPLKCFHENLHGPIVRFRCLHGVRVGWAKLSPSTRVVAGPD